MAMAITALSHLAAADAMRSGASASAAAVPVALPMQRSSAAASTSGSCFGGRLEDLRLPATTRRSSRRGSKRWQVLPTAAAEARSGDGGHHDRPCTPLLDGIHCPAHLKNLSSRELSQLSDELRSEAIFNLQAPAAGGDGGDLDSSLGVVELTVALHHVFNAPRDRIVWDAGNQAVPHKLLTGRRRRASGLTSRAESEYDAFGASHSAVAVSAALGMAVGRDLKGRDNHVVSVIGDGAMTAGQAFEAMSNAGYLEANMIVILNDSRRDEPAHASSPPSSPSSSCCSGDGPICPALSRLQASKPLRELREVAKNVTKQLSGTVHEIAARVDEVARGLIGGHASSLFDGLGVYYIGPVDGHNIQHLVTILNEVKSTQSDGPVLIHIVTEKGRGRPRPAAGAMGSSYGFEEEPSCAVRRRSSYSKRFADALVTEAEKDDDIVAVHAGMGRETGMDVFGERFPERCFDVGMAEQHAVTFAAGLACEGLKPFCAIPSSFLQRAYDQVVHDVDLQRLPVRFAIGGAGLNGAAAAGTFDVTYMACLSNMVVMAPADEAELARMVATAAAIDDRPSCFRFPSGYTGGVGVAAGRPKGVPLEAVGRGRVLVEGTQVALLGYGATVRSCLAAQAMLAERHGVSVTVADARFCKPLDRDLIRKLAGEHQALLTVEEGAIGGFGSHVAQFMALDGLLDGNLKWRPLVLPDYHINHGAHEDQLAQAGLTVAHIAATVLTLLGKKKEALQIF